MRRLSRGGLAGRGKPKRFRDVFAMSLGLVARQLLSAPPQSRVSPVSRAATLLTFALLAIGILASIATGFTLESLPNIILLVIAVLVLDVLSQFAPRIRIVEAMQTVLYGVLYLVITCVC